MIFGEMHCTKCQQNASVRPLQALHWMCLKLRMTLTCDYCLSNWGCLRCIYCCELYFDINANFLFSVFELVSSSWIPVTLILLERFSSMWCNRSALSSNLKRFVSRVPGGASVKNSSTSNRRLSETIYHIKDFRAKY